MAATPDTMLVCKNDQKYILSDGNYRERMIANYDRIIETANTLITHGNFAHGLSNVRYLLMHNNTILYLRCNNKDLKTTAHNMAVIGNALYMGAYNVPEKTRQLRGIVRECEDMKELVRREKDSKEAESL